MINILDKYKDRLVNISGRNRSLVSKKLYKKRAFDLHKVSTIDEELPSKIVEFISRRQEGSLEFLQDSERYIQDKIKEIERIIEFEKQREVQIAKNKSYDKITDEKKILAEIVDKYDRKLEAEIDKIKLKGNEIFEYSKSVRYLLREITHLEKETGRYELFIGYPFIEGTFKDGTFVKAPLFLFPIGLVENKGNWSLQNINTQEVVINKVLLIAFLKYNDIEIQDIETEFDNIQDRFNNLDDVLNYLSGFGISIKNKSDGKISKFKETKSDVEIKYRDGELELNEYLVLGQFPVANSIYSDYEELIEIYNDRADHRGNLLLKNLLICEERHDNVRSEEPFKELDSYCISSLDYSQEEAVKKVMEYDELVIYGPPGTGKSQTIANIISDSLAKGKRILMVSEKRAALDVIYNRLGELNNKTILLHDGNKDKKEFYNKIAVGLLNVASNPRNNFLKIINEYANEIQSRIDKLTFLGDSLTQKRDLGISLQQMYSLSKKLDSTNGDKYTRYRDFRKSKFNLELTYNEIKQSFNTIMDNNQYTYYKKHRDFLIEYPKLDHLEEKMDEIDVEDYIEELDDFLCKYPKNININIIDNEYLDEFYIVYDEFDKVLDDNDIKELAEKINKKENNLLLNPIRKDKFLKWFKEKKSNFNKYMALYSELEESIEEQEILQLISKINKENNGYLLGKLKKNDYLKDKGLSGDFKKFMELFNSIEDYIEEDVVINLAKEINENKNKYLLGDISKKDYIKSIDIDKKKYFNEFFELYNYLGEKIEEDIIEKLAVDINKNVNGHLLDPVDYGKVWTIAYWKNLKSNKEKEKENIDKYINREENIKNEFLKYSEEISNFIVEKQEENKKQFYNLQNALVNEFLAYREDIFKYVKNKKEENQKEYKNKEEALHNEFEIYKNEIDKFIEENRYKNKVEYDKLGSIIYNKLLNYYNNINTFRKEIGFIEKFINKDHLNEYKTKIYKRQDIRPELVEVLKALKVYDRFYNNYIFFNRISDVEKISLEYLYSLKDNEDIKENLQELLEFIILHNIAIIEKEEQIDLAVYKEFESIVLNVNNNMKRKHEVTPKYIIDAINKEFQNIRSESTNYSFKEFERQANKKRMLWPIRKYLSQYEELLFELFPCWLLAPDTVSEILPLKAELFDLIIFDEASQIFIENAIPTIYRGKKVIIAGDDKQLKPSSMFKTKMENGDEELDEFGDRAAALEEQSLLDLAKVNYKAVYLNYHYRSKYEELINFSNYAFYNGRLEVSPNIIKSEGSNNKPIERIMVKGQWINRQNLQEAKSILALVKKLLNDRKNNETIGIITFNINQQDLIEDLIEEECNKDSNFANLYLKEKNRVLNNEDVSIFVKNIENVQGDERDIIIFSIGYAPNENGKISLNFGALSQEGGENRLNVAISRAKEKIYIVTSIEPSELGNVDNLKNRGPKLFKKYLEYAKYISNGDKESAISLLNSLVEIDNSIDNEEVQEDLLGEEVSRYLTNSGYNVVQNIGVSGYKIDIGIYDYKTNSYVLGIELDGSAYESSDSTRERDIHRHRYLESRGWKIIRLWSKDWWENPHKEIEKIEKLLSVHNLLEDMDSSEVIKKAEVLEKDRDLYNEEENCKNSNIQEESESISKNIIKVEDPYRTVKEKINLQLQKLNVPLTMKQQEVIDFIYNNLDIIADEESITKISRKIDISTTTIGKALTTLELGSYTYFREYILNAKLQETEDIEEENELDKYGALFNILEE